MSRFSDSFWSADYAGGWQFHIESIKQVLIRRQGSEYYLENYNKESGRMSRSSQ